MIELGILDSAHSFASSLQCARLAERCGFERYWLTEHHLTDDAWASCEIPLAILATQTRKIRLGSAGNLLDFHNPARIANDFSFLSNVFPGRIELGLARGRPAHPANRAALGDGGWVASYSQRVASVREILKPGRSREGALPFAIPAPINDLAIWMLGSGEESYALAEENGLSYCHAMFLNDSQAINLSGGAKIQNRAVALSLICGETVQDASRILEELTLGVALNVFGDAKQCVERIYAAAKQSKTDTVVLMDLAISEADRLKTIRLISSEMGLAHS